MSSSSDVIRMSGMNSGLDTESIINAMMSTYQTKIDNQQKKLQTLSWQQEAYQDIITKVTDFQKKYFDVLNRDSYLMSKTTFTNFESNITSTGSSTKGLTVTTTSNSSEARYSLSVDQLATATTLEGSSMTPGNFKLNLDQAIEMSPYTESNDGLENNVRNYSFALDVKVGNVTKTVSFSASAALNESGTIADVDALKQSVVDSLNTQLKDSFGLSGRSGGDAAGAVDNSGNEYYLQTKIDSEGSLEFIVGGNATVNITENSGSFGLAAPEYKTAVSMSSVVTGTNSVAVKVGDTTHNVSFTGVSSTYYDSRDIAGGEDILAEYEELKLAAYRRENNLSESTNVAETTLADFEYTSAQAAADKNSQMLQEALNTAFESEGVTFAISGSYVTATNADGKEQLFTMASTSGGTLGLTKGTASNKYTAKTTLAAMGLEANGADGGYSMTINGVSINVAKDATIDGLITAVNRSDAGVTMSYSALTNSFSMVSNEMGSAGTVTIESNELTAALGLDSATTTAGQNAIFTLNGQKVYQNDNSYSIDGTTFKFDDDIELGSTFTVGLSKSYDDVKETIKNFVKDYNQLVEDVYGHIGTKPKTDSSGNKYSPLSDTEKEEMTDEQIEKLETAAKVGVIYNDSTVTSLMSQIRSTLYNSVTLDDGTTFGLYNMGITTSSDYAEHGKLVIDEDALDAAFEENADAVTKLFTDSTDGIMKKIDSIMTGAVKTTGAREDKGTLVQKAGLTSGSSATDNYIYDEMQDIKDMIKSLQTKYSDKEEYWWKVFTNLESMMSDLNNQTSYLSQYLGG